MKKMSPAEFSTRVTTLDNDKVNEVLDRYPLLVEGYAALECPHCEKMCFPQIKYKNGTIRYNTHLCQDKLFTWNEPISRSFSILENGEIKE